MYKKEKAANIDFVFYSKLCCLKIKKQKRYLKVIFK